MTDIVQEVAELAESVGLEVHGMGSGPQFARCPMVYGPLDSIAILVDQLMHCIELAPRRYRARRIRT